jgi:probable rRNA maturation factor
LPQARVHLQIDVCNEQSLVSVDEDRLRQAIARILSDGGFTRGTISLAIVDDATIRPLNNRYLGHDYATDVLSFVLEQNEHTIDGEVIVSAETALNSAAGFGWKAEDELLLYVIHGGLHLAGYDDLNQAALDVMREREWHYLKSFGLEPKYDA